MFVVLNFVLHCKDEFIFLILPNFFQKILKNIFYSCQKKFSLHCYFTFDACPFQLNGLVSTCVYHSFSGRSLLFVSL